MKSKKKPPLSSWVKTWRHAEGASPVGLQLASRQVSPNLRMFSQGLLLMNLFDCRLEEKILLTAWQSHSKAWCRMAGACSKIYLHAIGLGCWWGGNEPGRGWAVGLN